MNKWPARTIVLTIYHAIVGSIVAMTIKPNSWLMGWDGLYPELNIPLNLVRGISAGWQEYYGAGLVGGHGFGATLPHTAIIGILSTILAPHLVRQVFIFLCYYLGGLGMIFASVTLLRQLHQTNQLDHFENTQWYIGLVASLYYITNLATVQVFYVPLEAFTVHFASLPWLVYSLLLMLEKRTKKRTLAFIGILFLSSIQGFIPAVFVGYCMIVASLTGTFLFYHRFTKQAIQHVQIIWAYILGVNSYWALPVAYFTLTGIDTYAQAYNNIISTPKFIGLSIQYGSFANTALLRGYLWQAHELGGALMQPWITHNSQLIIQFIGFVCFTLAIFGAIRLLTAKRTYIGIGLFISFLYFFGNIAIDTPPFSWIITWIQTYSPSLAQAFRTTFTKFGIGLGFHYSLGIAVGLSILLHIIRKAPSYIHSLVLALISISLLAYGFPLWQQHLIYQKMYVQVPETYHDVINEINALPDGKIADFPQDCAEGWYNTTWGYFGSGFLWYGIRHPVMARVFDVWSTHNENYYWELSTALRQESFKDVDTVLDKYGVRYILYDQNTTHCRSQKGFLSSLSFSNYIASSANYKHIRTWSVEKLSPISLYERVSTPHSAVEVTNAIQTTSPQALYTDVDTIYAYKGVYQTDPSDRQSRYIDPLFSKRGTPVSTTTIDSLDIHAVATISASHFTQIDCSTPQTQNATLSDISIREKDIQLMSTNTATCMMTDIPSVNTSHAYLLEVQSKHTSGEPLHISVTNKGRPVGLDISLPKHTDVTRDYFSLPPTFPSEIEYDLTIENASYNHFTTINSIASVTLYEIHTPPHALSNTSRQTNTPPSIWHPVSWLYRVTMSHRQQEPQTLVLNQSYDPGWTAWVGNTPLTNHSTVNSWANGWELPPITEQQTIIIFFAPQLLQYLGFGLLLIPWIIYWRTKT